MSLKQKIESFGPDKNMLSQLLKINIRNMASNKHVDLRKIKQFVRSKCFPEDTSKDKGKKDNLRKSC